MNKDLQLTWRQKRISDLVKGGFPANVGFLAEVTGFRKGTVRYALEKIGAAPATYRDFVKFAARMLKEIR
jgi:hypothetical protein